MSLESATRSLTATEIKATLASGRVLSSDDADLLDLLEQWDTSGDGQYSVEEVLKIARKFRKKQGEVRILTKTLCVGVIVAVVFLLSMLLVTLGADQLAKDTRPNREGILTTRDGTVAGVASVTRIATLDLLTNLTDESLAGLQFVSFDLDNDHYIVKVEGAIRTGAGTVGGANSVDVFLAGNYVRMLTVCSDGHIQATFSNGTVVPVRSNARRLDANGHGVSMSVLGVQGRWARGIDVATAGAPWMHTGGFR